MARTNPLAIGRDLAIDLGTANTLIYARGQGVVLNEPSVVAIDITDGRPVAVGIEAKRMMGRTPGRIKTIRPLKDGVIADFEVCEKMLRFFIQKVHASRWSKPRMVICVPSGITGVEQRAVQDAAEYAGTRKPVHIIEEPMAAAIGADLPVHEPSGNMIVDIGGGTTEVAIMSLGDIACCESVRVAGDDFDEAIIGHMKKMYGLHIGEQTAERIKIEIGSAAAVGPQTTMDVRGRDMVTGLPRKTTVTSDEIRESLSEPVKAISEAVRRTLENAEPELSADLVENGVTLAGGGALLRGMDVVLNQSTGLTVKIADDPLTCVARGTAIYLESLEAWKSTLESDADEY
ncbi:MAG: rod shape-determining protein [Planctomycetes bacterium]|nr:rod shape-determining protein [Planctomycetota bacterium]